MSIKSTLLREPRNRAFLLAQRRDPVTHKVFAVGDRVTQCAACQTPFLEQSWEAIGRTHCDQTASVALHELDAPAPTPGGPRPAKPVGGKQGRPAKLPLELAAIPISLREVPNTLN